MMYLTVTVSGAGVGDGVGTGDGVGLGDAVGTGVGEGVGRGAGDGDGVSDAAGVSVSVPDAAGVVVAAVLEGEAEEDGRNALMMPHPPAITAISSTAAARASLADGFNFMLVRRFPSGPGTPYSFHSQSIFFRSANLISIIHLIINK